MTKNHRSEGALSKGGESDSYSDEEIARRRDDVIWRMANTPPKPHSAMKAGKRDKKKLAQPQKPTSR
jgi:hypothetical protein